MRQIKDIQGLKDSFLSVNLRIKRQVESRITRPYKDCENLGSRIYGIISYYRTRAILEYLLNADLNAFFEDLNREALTYVTLLQAYHHKLDVPESRINGSTYYPLVCALAGNNFKLSNEIDNLMLKAFGEYDSEELFTYTTMLRKLVIDNNSEIINAFDAFKAACKGFLRYDHKIKAIQGLINNDAETFNSGLLGYLESFANLSYAEAEEMDPGEEYIDLESLAFIQLAKRKNIPITIEHEMIPKKLQDAKLIIPTAGYPSWPG
ncbi:MAG: Imm49 family immunity protein [Patescibacteria group bacterium]